MKNYIIYTINCVIKIQILNHTQMQFDVYNKRINLKYLDSFLESSEMNCMRSKSHTYNLEETNILGERKI